MNSRCGTLRKNSSGRVVEVIGKVKLGDMVTWQGRTDGFCSDEDSFEIGQIYPVVFIHPSNADVELGAEVEGERVTIRARDTEYSLFDNTVEAIE